MMRKITSMAVCLSVLLSLSACTTRNVGMRNRNYGITNGVQNQTTNFARTSTINNTNATGTLRDGVYVGYGNGNANGNERAIVTITNGKIDDIRLASVSPQTASNYGDRVGIRSSNQSITNNPSATNTGTGMGINNTAGTGTRTGTNYTTGTGTRTGTYNSNTALGAGDKTEGSAGLGTRTGTNYTTGTGTLTGTYNTKTALGTGDRTEGSAGLYPSRTGGSYTTGYTTGTGIRTRTNYATGAGTRTGTNYTTGTGTRTGANYTTGTDTEIGTNYTTGTGTRTGTNYATGAGTGQAYDNDAAFTSRIDNWNLAINRALDQARR